jgi:hypothetical protein
MLFWLISALGLVSWSSLPELPRTGEFKLHPKAIFQREATTVMVSLRVEGALPPNTRYELLRQNPKGQYVDAGPLLDDGRLGDLHVGDGVYSTKIQVTQKPVKPVLFRAALVEFDPSNPRKIVKELTTTSEISVEVVARPSFMEILRGLVAKVFARSSAEP